MKTENKDSQPTNHFSLIPFVLNMKSPMRYASYSVGTPYEQIGRNPNVSICFTVEIAGKILYAQSMYCIVDFFHKKKLYIPGSDHEIQKYHNWLENTEVNNLLNNGGIAINDLVNQMEEEQKQILCISKSSIELACELITARTNAILFNKYWTMLPNGEDQKNNADEKFEQLCSEAKIPRRTRVAIRRKQLATFNSKSNVEEQLT